MRNGVCAPASDQLCFYQETVSAIACDEFVVGAAFDDFPLAEDEDGVGVADGGKAVGDDETGAAFHETFECFIDKPLAFGAKGGGGFVEQEDAGIGQNGAGDGDALALAPDSLVPRGPTTVAKPSGILQFVCPNKLISGEGVLPMARRQVSLC